MVETNLTMARILDALQGARRVIDIGCGAGRLTRALAGRGFEAIGLDPQAALIEAARARIPEATFMVAAAEAIPVEDAAFDAAVFLNALHHVPEGAMAPALREALRVVRPGGVLAVIEPLAEGGYFEAMRPVDDETLVRRKAMDALDALKEEGGCALTGQERYEVANRVDDLASFLASLERADPARAKAIRQQRDAVARAFAGHAREDGTAFVLMQPMLIWVFRKA